MDKLIISDTHYHNFDRFAQTNSAGVNTRLASVIDATTEAAALALEKGVGVMIHAGDCFHVRGKISPTVLNPVLDLYKSIVDKGIRVYMIAGNHDLESRDSNELSNTASALQSVGVNVINEVTVVEDIKCVFFPWHSSLTALKDAMRKASADLEGEFTAVIHAPMNGVLANIPDNGLDTKELNSLGYKRIYCGHYHNHKVFDSVVSVGALTHQNFGDIFSKAGFILELGGEVKHFETSVPKFVDVDMLEAFSPEEFSDLVAGNFVRARLEDADEKDIANLRADLESADAAGVLITSTSKRATTTKRSVSAKSGVTIAESISTWCKERDFDKHRAEIEKTAIDLLGEI